MKGKTVAEQTWLARLISHSSRFSGSNTFRGSDSGKDLRLNRRDSRNSQEVSAKQSHELLRSFSNMSVKEDNRPTPSLPGQREQCTDLVVHLTTQPSSRNPNIALVEGPLGVGKSDMLSSVIYDMMLGEASTKAAAGLNMIRCCAASSDVSVPFLAAHELLASLIHLDSGEGADFVMTEVQLFPFTLPAIWQLKPNEWAGL
eukprot:scaffold51641_cov45-Prasinocladus_malaysianus.AAC.2